MGFNSGFKGLISAYIAVGQQSATCFDCHAAIFRVCFCTGMCYSLQVHMRTEILLCAWAYCNEPSELQWLQKGFPCRTAPIQLASVGLSCEDPCVFAPATNCSTHCNLLYMANYKNLMCTLWCQSPYAVQVMTFISLLQTWSTNLTFRGPCIVVYFYNKTN